MIKAKAAGGGGGEGGKEKPYKTQYNKDATNAEHSKILSTCKGAHINYTRIPLAMQPPKALNQAQNQ